MRLGIFAKTFAGRAPDTVLRAAQAAGYQGVQYNMACSGLDPMPDSITAAVLGDIAAAARATGIELQALSGTYNMAHPDPAVRADGQARLGLMIKAAGSLGVPLVTLCTGSRDGADQWRHHPENASPQAWADMCAGFDAAIPLAEAAGVFLGVEPELANVVSSARAARRLMDQMQSDRIRIVLDPANLFEQASSAQRLRLVDDAIALLGDRIAMAHAKDRHADGRFAAAGQGVIDFDHFLRRLTQAGFDGPLVTHGLEGGQAVQVADFLRQRLQGLSP